MNATTRVVRDAITSAPVTIRELSRRCGVSHAQLARIVAGERSATPFVALAVARGLEAIASEAASGARRIQRSLTSHNRRNK
jgi:transcriptional regulator with XRE-family HTH domain